MLLPRLLPYGDKSPVLGARVFVAPDATLVGDVTLGDDASVFFQSVLRADINAIRVGARSNIQDHCTVHLASDVPVIVGDDVNVGHRCILHACTIGDRVLVGMGSIIMDKVVIGEDSIVGAGSLVPKGKIFPPGSLLVGSPARLLRPLTEEEKASIPKLAKKYVGVKDEYLKQLRITN
jgi:carbonic anhydrase/acetyltransferase-like protein (isoleucine patch superfamily)